MCGDRDETINHIINECGNLAQREYKTRHDSLGVDSLGIVQEIEKLTILPNGICTNQNPS